MTRDAAMTGTDPTARIEEIMDAYRERTGESKRYLWTDAFAVCNYLELHRRTGDGKFLDRAGELVDQVHRILGRHREDDPRRGWISGLNEADGKRHPTRGGLRIGKSMPERLPGEPYNERTEWDRDGQYFHYLTKWMHALCAIARASGESRYLVSASDLAKSAHAAFTYRPGGSGKPRMFWKMSIDLTRPLVPSMGHHDPLDALITYQLIKVIAEEMDLEIDLEAEIADAADMCAGASWQTADPLGVGGLLMDACGLAMVMTRGPAPRPDRLGFLLKEAQFSIIALLQSGGLSEEIEYRLAFRELGLAIGLHAIARIEKAADQHPEKFTNRAKLKGLLSRLSNYVPLAGEIEALWLEPVAQQSATWKNHEDINSIMLAASLGPDGYLTI